MSGTDDVAWETVASIAHDARALLKRDRSVNLTSYYLGILGSHADNEIIRRHLRQCLRHEYLRQENFKAATEVALTQIAERPLHPMPVLGLVGQKLYNENDPAGALPSAIKAVALADAIREFRRHARANLLRVASAQGDTALVQKCLVEIMDLDLVSDEPDVAREADLLVHAKAVGVELSILHRYRRFLGTVSLPITGELPRFRSNEEDEDLK